MTRGGCFLGRGLGILKVDSRGTFIEWLDRLFILESRG